MNGIDALKAKFADVELKANARTMEEVLPISRKTGAHFV